MKKIYRKPLIKVIEIIPDQSILAISGPQIVETSDSDGYNEEWD